MREGNDEEGTYVSEVLHQGGIDIRGLVMDDDKTSFTEVMSVINGQGDGLKILKKWGPSN